MVSKTFMKAVRLLVLIPTVSLLNPSMCPTVDRLLNLVMEIILVSLTLFHYIFVDIGKYIFLNTIPDIFFGQIRMCPQCSTYMLTWQVGYRCFSIVAADMAWYWTVTF